VVEDVTTLELESAATYMLAQARESPRQLGQQRKHR
jgi:hypothetical protein